MIRETSAPAPPGRRLGILGLTLAVAGAVVTAALLATWLLGGTLFPQPRTLADLLASSTHLAPVEATSTLCAEPGCVEGYSTDVGDYLRFASNGEAEYWATVLGDDGRRWENVVLDMSGRDLTLDERRLAIDALFVARDWN